MASNYPPGVTGSEPEIAGDELAERLWDLRKGQRIVLVESGGYHAPDGSGYSSKFVPGYERLPDVTTPATVLEVRQQPFSPFAWQVVVKVTHRGGQRRVVTRHIPFDSILGLKLDS